MQVRVQWTQAWLCTKDFRRKCTGAGVAAKVAVPSNAAQRGGTRRSQIGPGGRGDVEQDNKLSQQQVAPGEVPETGTTRMRETVLTRVTQRSPTSPETNLESRAMQVRVPWTQAWLCTKDFRRKCTGAGVAAKVAVPSNAV
ncbi:hypothetical protein NDU88_007222 [Pleurodeles waltl]|uniref:Uncharacterized protein n=1 Tax=Pleurodeles waltl TaxID=8319 RepID=A0AAV7PL74_PLEWA|nr:hypothetical protein NDU88_007222 [Pleurodeles waltl]